MTLPYVTLVTMQLRTPSSILTNATVNTVEIEQRCVFFFKMARKLHINCYNVLNFPAGDDEESKTSTNLPLVVGVSCGAVVILAVLAICIAFRLKRSSASHNISRDGDGVLADEAFPIREQYELKPTDSREEKIISMEEKGLCNEGM